MRLPYVPNPPHPANADEAAIIERLIARRDPGPLQSLDLTLLHAPAIADGWASFLGAVRNKSSLPADIRETAILRVAVLTGSKYEVNEHTPYAQRVGVRERGLREIFEGRKLAKSEGEGLSEQQWVTVRFAEVMTKDIIVSDEVFKGVRNFLNDKQVVELTATVAAINCAARFLRALDVGEFDKKEAVQ